MSKEIDMILWRNKHGYTMSQFLTKEDYQKKIREDINTLCTYKENDNEDVATD